MKKENKKRFPREQKDPIKVISILADIARLALKIVEARMEEEKLMDRFAEKNPGLAKSLKNGDIIILNKGTFLN